MRILLIADVHANWDALLALQRAERRPDAVLFAGDAVGYGPDPAACARWLLANAATCVRGDHEDALAGGAGRWPPELADAARETLDYARRQLAPADLAGLAAWPRTATVRHGAARFHLRHGDDGPGEIALCPEAELERYLDGVEADVIVVGHSHRPAIRQLGARVVVSPGSLGQPRYGVPDATFAAWEDGRLQIHHLHYDHDAPAAKLRLVPLSPEVIEQLAQVLETGML
jgi:putative phosphoesterase